MMNDGDLRIRTKRFYFDTLDVLKGIKKELISVEIIK